MMTLSLLAFNITFWVGSFFAIALLISMIFGPFLVLGYEVYSDVVWTEALWDAGTLFLVSLSVLIILVAPLTLIGWYGRESTAEILERFEALADRHFNSLTIQLSMVGCMIFFWLACLFSIVSIVAMLALPVFIIIAATGPEPWTDVISIGVVCVVSLLLGWLFQRISILLNNFFEQVVETLTGKEYKARWR